ncbi:MAG TPA: tripartite tricarboxylate transporter substrate binding protein [Xanthobacteraceae bacterium]|jgi:tripartite-type tricarboxylate transporter receptor subunit TctC|nr:tripartite tricarboxylate transporter substrate binding protein [Xanthobacteraceae bacterium]
MQSIGMRYGRSFQLTVRDFIIATLACLAMLGASIGAAAEDYPSRPVRIIVPTGPGGGYDLMARLLAEQLSIHLGRSVYVENKLGAGTVVGTQAAIAASSDGYTLLAGGLSNIVFNASLYRVAPYDPLKQLVPVAIVYRLSYMLIGSNETPFSNVKDVIAAAKAKPNTLNVATAGVGTGQQLTAVAFMKGTNTKLVEVPYKGATAVYPDLVAGRVDLFFDSISVALPFVQSGKVKGFAVLAPHRSKGAPNVPTMEEAGVAGINVDSWIGLFAPAGTPKLVIERLQKEISDSAPELTTKFSASGAEYMWVPPENLDNFVRAQYDQWTKLIKEAGITAE